MREPGLAATVGYITREPTCSWCNRPLTLPPLPRLSWNTESVIGVLIPLVYQHAPVWHTRYCTQTLTLSLPLTHTSKHAHTHSLIRYEHTHKNTHPLSGKSPPKTDGQRHPWYEECIIRPGCRNVARRFISVQAWSLYFCLWMLRSCSSSPAPLPRLLQCL